MSPTRGLTLLEIANGLPDDSREADEHEEERRLRDLRARVNRILLEDLVAKLIALKALYSMLRDPEGEPPFGDIVARSRPK